MKRVLALTLVLLLVLGGCGQRSVEPEPQTQPSAAVPTETEPAPTEPVAVPTEPEPTQPESLLHSGIREDGSFDRGTLFIGDSLTYGLLSQHLTENNLLGDARYMVTPGAAPTAYFYGPMLRRKSETFSFYSPEFENMYMADGVEAMGEDVTALYFMMGTNHTDNVTQQLYLDIVGHMLEACPNATIYLQLVPFSTNPVVDAEAANNRVRYTYDYYVEQGVERIQLVDTQSAIDYHLTVDGIHLTEKGNACWYEALVAYARENGIPQ